MKQRSSVLYSILHSKCPRCHEGDVFVSKNPYDIKNMAAMHKKCRVCGQHTEPENGFYWGAMFVSYALTVGLGFIVTLLMLYFNFSLIAALVAISILLIFVAPLTFRYSRMVWFNIFCHHDKNFVRNS